MKGVKNMTIVFGNTREDNNNLQKTFTRIKEVNANMKNDTSITNPIFELSFLELSNLKNVNYCYVSDLGRYYFVNDISMNVGGIMEVQCSVDVLMSFANQIKEIKGTVKRAQNLNNGYIVDDEYHALSYSNIVTKKFPFAMDTDSFILMTVG